MKNENDKELDYNVYLEERKLLVDACREGARSFDKAILALSAGAFGLSLLFIKEIESAIQPGTLFFLAASWICLALSMLMTLISFLTSQSACTRQIEILEAKRICENQDQNNLFATVTRYLNIAAIASFIIGIALLSTFAILNLKEGKMAKKDPTIVEKGFVPPQPPKPHPGPEKIDGGYVPQKPPQPPKPPTEKKK